MVFVDRIQIGIAGSKPYDFHWFFQPRLSDLLPLCCPSSCWVAEYFDDVEDTLVSLLDSLRNGSM